MLLRVLDVTERLMSRYVDTDVAQPTLTQSLRLLQRRAALRDALARGDLQIVRERGALELRALRRLDVLLTADRSFVVDSGAAARLRPGASGTMELRVRLEAGQVARVKVQPDA